MKTRPARPDPPEELPQVAPEKLQHFDLRVGSPKDGNLEIVEQIRVVRSTGWIHADIVCRLALGAEWVIRAAAVKDSTPFTSPVRRSVAFDRR
jgi:hypothetical protein